MKAPETIFLHGYSFDDKPCKDWTLEPLKRGLRGYAVQNEKYIRKDALLEWLRKEYETISWYYEKMKHITGSVGDNSSSGKAEAYKKIIEKIESL